MNTPAEGNQRFHLWTESLRIPVKKPGRNPPTMQTCAFKPLRILPLNVEGLSAAKCHIIQSLCIEHSITVMSLQYIPRVARSCVDSNVMFIHSVSHSHILSLHPCLDSQQSCILSLIQGYNYFITFTTKATVQYLKTFIRVGSFKF